MTAPPQVCDAILVQGDGATPHCLTIGSIPCPQPQEGEVLIRVAAAGVNGADILQRQGLYPPPPNASDIMGLEAAGTVAALGDGCHIPHGGKPRLCHSHGRWLCRLLHRARRAVSARPQRLE